MHSELKVKNIVLIGAIDPNSYDKYFFIINDIIKENEIINNSSIFNFGITQLVCNNYNLQVNPNQIIISSNSPEKETVKIEEIAIKIIKANPVIITALGINFHWALSDGGKSLEQISKECFFSDKISLFSNCFSSNDSMYGLYASKTFLDSRLKLDVKPTVQNILNDPNAIIESFILFSFNFHFDIKDKKDASEPIKYLNNFNLYKKEGENIISIYK